MFKYTLKFNKSLEKATYGPSFLFRGITLFFSVFLLYFFVLSIIEGTYTDSALVPLFIAILLLLTSLYRDEFVFDKPKQEVVIKFGVGPFFKKEVISYSDIQRIELTHFVKGKLGDNAKASKHNKAQVTLLLRLFNDDEKKLEVYSERSSAGKLENIANQLAVFTNLPIFVDREREEEPIDLKSLR